MKNDIVVNFSDILKITTHKTVSRVEDEKEDTISKGILDSIFMGEPIPESNMPFDDSERRKKAKSNQKNRKLEVCYNDFFLFFRVVLNFLIVKNQIKV